MGSEYQEGRFWYRLRGSDVTVGLTSAAVEDLGAPRRVEFREIGDSVAQEEPLATIQGTRLRLEVLSPASGTVTEINEELMGNLQALTEDPIEEGWLVKLEIQDPQELEQLS